MGVSQNLGNVSANVTGFVQSGVPTGAVMKVATNSAAAATTTVYTVTAGKTLYITSLSLCMANTAASQYNAYVTVDIGGGDVAVLYLDARGIATYQTGYDCIAISPGGLLAIPATKLIKVTSGNAAAPATCCMTGYEV
jgi:hypothetical protein